MADANAAPRRVSMAYILGFSNKPFKDGGPPAPPPAPRHPSAFKQMVTTPGGVIEWAASDGRRGRLTGPGKPRLTAANLADVPQGKAPSAKGADEGDGGIFCGGIFDDAPAAKAASAKAADDDQPASSDWTTEQDEKLMKLKGETKPWADIAAELDKKEHDCKERFKQIKPKDWKPTNAKGGGGGKQKSKKGQKQQNGDKKDGTTDANAWTGDSGGNNTGWDNAGGGGGNDSSWNNDSSGNNGGNDNNNDNWCNTGGGGGGGGDGDGWDLGGDTKAGDNNDSGGFSNDNNTGWDTGGGGGGGWDTGANNDDSGVFKDDFGGVNNDTTNGWDTGGGDSGNGGPGGWDTNNNGGGGDGWGVQANDASNDSNSKKASSTKDSSDTANKRSSNKVPSQSGSKHRSSRGENASSSSRKEYELKPDSTFSADDLRLIAKILQQDCSMVWNRVSWRFKDKTGRNLHPDVFEKKITGKVEDRGSERGRR